ncbi:hypothetical protein OESDEN_04533 [Oesophagostomum dentatum]|uniref:SXP/RAL-2 family protein Ani s 5-like cation-binding domain-containing protein n=1 Tax=Oesophagostomum dentatum TaxID=61180 RepID=A0A0B1TI83_OESDE|nr:hypothetical protein OESDEN_04533 [Oesophagostomum dentatum]
MIRFILPLGLLSVVCGATHPIDRYIILNGYFISVEYPVTPGVLENATREASKEYFDILSEEENTFAQINEKLQAWAKKHNLEKEYREGEDALKKSTEERNKQVLAMISNLSAVTSEYDEINENVNLTTIERRNKIRELMQKDPNVSSLITYGRLLDYSVDMLWSKLSAVYNEYVGTEEDVNLTLTEKRNKIRELVQKYPKELTLIHRARRLATPWSLTG